MSSIQAYKAYKQEGTLVSKVHKQGALGTSSQASLHQWLHDNCRIYYQSFQTFVGYAIKVSKHL